MISLFGHVFRRSMSTNPTSRFVKLPNSSIVDENGEITSNSMTLHYWEWPGNKPTILFCHAASFHGRCYDRIIEQALRGFHVISVDLRGHGRSQKHSPPYHFRWFGEDVLNLIEKLQLNNGNLLGIGHSVGGYALTLAAAKTNRRLFKSLLLLDPVIFPPTVYEFYSEDSFNVEPILRRKDQFSSVDDMFSRMSSRGPFSKWPKDILRDYCTYALDENFKLQCAPRGEATIYTYGSHPDNNIYPFIEKSNFIQETPIHLVRSCLDFSVGTLNESPTSPELAQHFRNCKETRLDDGEHLFPMEQPQIAIDLVKQFIKEHATLNSSL